MPLACDYAPLDNWIIPWPSIGPYYVDSWDTSFTASDGSKVKAYRVVGKSGFQLHTREGGCVIQWSKVYAQMLCDAANNGELQCETELKLNKELLCR